MVELYVFIELFKLGFIYSNSRLRILINLINSLHASACILQQNATHLTIFTEECRCKDEVSFEERVITIVVSNRVVILDNRFEASQFLFLLSSSSSLIILACRSS